MPVLVDARSGKHYDVPDADAENASATYGLISTEDYQAQQEHGGLAGAIDSGISSAVGTTAEIAAQAGNAIGGLLDQSATQTHPTYTGKDIAPVAYTPEMVAARKANPTAAFVGALAPDLATTALVPEFEGAGLLGKAASIGGRAVVGGVGSEAGETTIQGDKFSSGDAMLYGVTGGALESAGSWAFGRVMKSIGQGRDMLDAAVSRAQRAALTDASSETDSALKAGKLADNAGALYEQHQESLDGALGTIDERMREAPEKMFGPSALKKSVSNNYTAQAANHLDLWTNIAQAAEVTDNPALHYAEKVLSAKEGESGAAMFRALRDARAALEGAGEEATASPLFSKVAGELDDSLRNQGLWGRAAKNYASIADDAAAAAAAADAGAAKTFSVHDLDLRGSLEQRLDAAEAMATQTGDKKLAKAVKEARQAVSEADAVTGAKVMGASGGVPPVPAVGNPQLEKFAEHGVAHGAMKAVKGAAAFAGFHVAGPVGAMAAHEAAELARPLVDKAAKKGSQAVLDWLKKTAKDHGTTIAGAGLLAGQAAFGDNKDAQGYAPAAALGLGLIGGGKLFRREEVAAARRALGHVGTDIEGYLTNDWVKRDPRTFKKIVTYGERGDALGDVLKKRLKDKAPLSLDEFHKEIFPRTETTVAALEPPPGLDKHVKTSWGGYEKNPDYEEYARGKLTELSNSYSGLRSKVRSAVSALGEDASKPAQVKAEDEAIRETLRDALDMNPARKGKELDMSKDATSRYRKNKKGFDGWAKQALDETDQKTLGEWQSHEYRVINADVRGGDAAAKESAQSLAHEYDAKFPGMFKGPEAVQAEADTLAGKSRATGARLLEIMNQAIDAGHVVPGRVTRGISMTEDEVAKLAQAETVTAQGFMSTSIHSSTPKGFAERRAAEFGEVPVMLSIEQRTGVPIGQGEGELTLRPGTTFSVSHVDRTAEGVTAHLVETGPSTLTAKDILAGVAGKIPTAAKVAGGLLALGAATEGDANASTGESGGGPNYTRLAVGALGLGLLGGGALRASVKDELEHAVGGAAKRALGEGIEHGAVEGAERSGKKSLSAAELLAKGGDPLAEHVGGQGGVTSGGFYRGTDGVERYAKFLPTNKDALNEAATSAVYADFGVRSLKLEAIERPTVPGGEEWGDLANAKNEQTVLMSERLPEEWKPINKFTAAQLAPSAVSDYVRGIPADIILGNWDISPNPGNLFSDGSRVMRLDVGEAGPKAFFNVSSPGSDKQVLWEKFQRSITDTQTPVWINKPGQVPAAGGVTSLSAAKSDLKAGIGGIESALAHAGGPEAYAKARFPHLTPKEQESLADSIVGRLRFIKRNIDKIAFMALGAGMGAALSEGTADAAELPANDNGPDLAALRTQAVESKLTYLQAQSRTAISTTARALASPVPNERAVPRLPGLTNSAGVAGFLGMNDNLRSAYDEKKTMLQKLQQDPMTLVDEMTHSFDALADAAPELHQKVVAQTYKVAQFLQGKLPGTIGASLARPDGSPPSPLAVRQFALYYSAATDPSSVLTDLTHNRARREQVDTLRELWPDTYSNLKQAVVEQMANGRPTVAQRSRMDLLFDFGDSLDKGLSPRLVDMLSQYRAQNDKGQAGGGGGSGGPAKAAPGRRTQPSIAGASPLAGLGFGVGPNPAGTPARSTPSAA